MAQKNLTQMAKTYDHETYVSLINSKGDYINYDNSFEIIEKDQDSLRQKFLSSPVFEGKTFWEVKKELEWLEDSGKEEILEPTSDNKNKQ